MFAVVRTAASETVPSLHEDIDRWERTTYVVAVVSEVTCCNTAAVPHAIADCVVLVTYAGRHVVKSGV